MDNHQSQVFRIEMTREERDFVMAALARFRAEKVIQESMLKKGYL